MNSQVNVYKILNEPNLDYYSRMKLSMKLFNDDFQDKDLHAFNMIHYKDFFIHKIKNELVITRDHRMYILSQLASVFACEPEYANEYNEVCDMIKFLLSSNQRLKLK